MTTSNPSVLRDGLLAGKSAFITGGTSGINLGIACRFAQAGARVTILGRNPEKAQRAADEVRKFGPDVLALTADVRDYAALDAAIRTSVEKHGPIDILINGAAGNFPAPAVGISANGFKAVVDIDLLGTFNACRAAFEHLRKPGANVLSISATQGSVPTLAQVHACSAKAGVEMLTRVLALEWGPAGVRVNAIAPGGVEDTEGMRRLSGGSEESRKKGAETVPLKRFTTCAELAEVVLFLVSPAAAYIHGAVIPVDGGHAIAGFGTLPMGGG
ncbi:SDR family oxidoreductase [Pendulispora albinea]|uniref:SDR family oxidoreductase n=1 Tax=Pendulispora albinea TaxID=2741071 RepID=A0ABZ2LXX0_9BACT